MLHLGRDPALSHRQSRHALGLGPRRDPHALHRHRAVQAFVVGPPHLAHAAAAQGLDQAVAPGNQPLLLTWSLSHSEGFTRTGEA
ncbi:hypothetical protein Aglo01_64870 [Actinokineospora globicatena]|nr:hypothetical protein Aglo01_64870 [Actinokineospora globicatena]GLW88800.1 hypothetical protein Aglo02_64390 [Actinokineospora globicatena]